MSVRESTEHRHAAPRLHLVMAVLSLAFLYMVSDFVVPMLLGMAFAGAMRPVQVRLRRALKLGPASSAGVTTVVLLLGILLPLGAVGVGAARSLLKVVEFATTRANEALSGGGSVLDELLKNPWIARAVALVERVSPMTQAQLRSAGVEVVQRVGTVLGQALGGWVQQTPEAVLFIFILLVAVYYSLVDGNRLEQWLEEQSPFDRAATQAVFSEVKQTSGRTLASSIAVSATQAAVLLLAMFLAGMPAPLVWTTVAFVMAFLPLVGTMPVSIGCVLYMAAVGDGTGAIIMLVGGVVAGVSDNVVRPFIIGGGESELHPLVTLMSLFGGLGVLGVPGLVLGPVLATLFFAVLKRYADVVRPEETVEQMQDGAPATAPPPPLT